MKERISTPQSRAVRLSQGILQGDYEDIAYGIYSGNEESLRKSIVRLELIDELHKSKAIEQLRFILLGKLSLNGGLVGIDEINQAVHEWRETDVLDGWEREI